MFIEFKKLFSSLIVFQFFGKFILCEIPRLRGVSIAQSSLYAPADSFTCFDGLLTIKYLQVNDDFCDCADGTDEPGTSACPNGRFHCVNAGHRSEDIPSSRVNDGICDCCDGSDEYASNVQCANICSELGKEEKERQKLLAELAKKGGVVRTEMSAKGKALKEEHQTRLADLEQSIAQAAALKTEREQIKQGAESAESAALEVYKQAEEEEKRKKQELEATENRREAETTFKQFDSNSDEVIEIAELQTRVQFDSNRDGQVTEDEAKYFLDQHDQVDLETFVTVCWPRVKPYLMLDAGLFKPPASVDEVTDQHEHQERDIDERHETDTENDNVDSEETAELATDPEEDVDTYDETEEVGEGEVEPVQAAADPQYDEETQRLMQEANEARNQFDVADRELRQLETEKRQLEDLLAKDYGSHEEYAVLNGECFNFEDREYVYKLCPFDKASQQPKNGGSETR